MNRKVCFDGDRRNHRLAVSCLAGLALALFAVAGEIRAQVINEDFEAGLPVGGLNTIGTATVLDDGSGNNMVLSLTQGANSQAGFAWFEQQFDLSNQRVEIEFDMFIGRSTSATPADGMSVIFQFDGDLNATGGGGGGLGVSNFRGNQSPYVAVSFDIWDNGGADPETPCDGRNGPDSTCTVELNQNNPDPGTNTSQAFGSSSPDFIASAAQYVAGGFQQADLLHINILFDNRLMRVKISGGIGNDGVTPFPETVVIRQTTAPFPERLSNVGFAASTGGANAHQWIDNLVVKEGDSVISFESEPPITGTAGINCAGPAVDATAEIGVNFRADAAFGAGIAEVGDLENGLTIITSRFGRVSTGADFTNNNTRPLDLSQIPGAGPQTAKVLADDAWSTVGVHYRAEVEPGKYEVKFYWHENFAGAVTSQGLGTKLYDVLVNGDKVLCNWSAASAAGSPTGSGDPNVPCNAVLDTAIVRTFTANAPDIGGGSGIGVLDLVVDDLGGGNPPENAALHALSLRRLGPADNAPVSGDMECLQRPPAPAPGELLIEEDFDDEVENQCPAEMVCNGTTFVPKTSLDLIDGSVRLRVTEDLIGNTAATAIFQQTIDVADFSMKASFDVFMSWGDDQAPADGGSFFVMQGNNLNAIGPAGGSNGIPTNAYGFAVEFDTWNNTPGGGFDPSGFNDPATAFTHVGVGPLSFDTQVNNVSFDPNLKPVIFGGTGWPDFRNPQGVHAEITYNSGHIEVTLTGVTEDGSAFGPTLVAEADVPPIWLPEAVIGFSGGTGGANQTLEFDNVTIEGKPGTLPAPGVDPLTDALKSARDRWNSSKGELFINCGGDTLSCSPRRFPAPGASGHPDEGDQVVWVADNVGGGRTTPFIGEFFTVTPVPNVSLQGNPQTIPAHNLQVATTNMGNWDARGTAPGVDDSDRIFHTERFNDMQYDLPVENSDYEVILYFANSFSGTAGTARRFFHVEIEGVQQAGFEHCQHSGLSIIGNRINNPLFGWDQLFDPVGQAEMVYSSDPCNFAKCASNGVTVTDDPDNDRITAQEECGNAAAVALKYDVTVTDGTLTIALTEPDTRLGEPLSPDMNPKISGIYVRRKGEQVGPPTELAAVAGNQEVRLSWTAPAGGPAAAGYNVYRTRPGVRTKVNTAPVTATQFTVTGLVNDIENCFVVRAVDNASTESVDSNEACATPRAGGGFKRGDVDANGAVEITDPINLLGFLFLGEAQPPCFDAADADDNGSLEITDAIVSLGFQFLGDPPPPAPGPTVCGPDPTADPPGADFGCDYPPSSCAP